MKRSFEEYLQTPYRIVDILPRQVPGDSPGQYFAVERYYLSRERLSAVKQKHIELILKLNCYRDLSLGEAGPVNPPPEQIAAVMREHTVGIFLDDAMILSEPDDTHLTLFHPDRELVELVRLLAAGEGLYIWSEPDFV